ncbi:MAG TPA: RNA-binding S4 domain-containing protein [Planctomycetota bacterium]|nr:RNA-binding S4 domain-containing protein [Planctomycetota bacterium]
MSKKHPGINEWKKHIQLGRRKPGEAAPIAEPISDTRKPPGWQGRAAKAKDRRAGSAAKPVTYQGKPTSTGNPGAAKPAPTRPGAGKPAPAKPTAPVITPSKRVLVRPLDGEGRPYITLVQFLKSISAVETGGAGKHAVRAGGILVNGTEELRPGRKLHTGDVVKIAGAEHRITV